MRKFLLSAFVVITFVAYAFHQKQTGADSVALFVPESNPANSRQSLPVRTSRPVTDTPTGPPPAGGIQITATPVPATPTPLTAPAHSGYKDGQYTGTSADAYYGNIQVRITVSGGKITDVRFLDYPQDRNTSVMINSQAMPYLKSEAIQAQSAQVDIVSGATDSSLAFRQSLQSALDQAR